MGSTLNAEGNSTVALLPKSVTLGGFLASLCQASRQWYIHFSVANLVPKSSATVASASPTQTAKTDLLSFICGVTGALTDKVAVITGGVIHGALLIGCFLSIISLMVHVHKNQNTGLSPGVKHKLVQRL